MVSRAPFLFGQLTLFLLGKKKGSMKKLALFLSILLILLVLPLVSATDTKLVIKDTPIKNEISYTETARFELEIENPLLVTEEVYIVAPITDWTIALSNSRVIVPYGQSRSVTLTLTPPSDIGAGKYISCFTFKALKHPVVSNHRCVFVVVTEGAPTAVEPEPEGEAKIVIDEQVIDKFLYSTHIINIKNEGDAIAKDEYTVTFELLSSFFVTSTPLSSGIRSVTEGKEFYWQYVLNPGESKEISYTVSFFPLIVSIAIVIIAVIFLMSFYMSGLSIEKKLLIPTKAVHGKKSVKVKLSIKNSTNRELKNVHVEDYIPTPLTLVEHFGTLEPSVVKKLENKVKLVWRIPEMAPKEERVLSYGFRSKMEVLGKIMLPRARIIYKKKGAKKPTAVYSGILIIKGKKEERLE